MNRYLLDSERLVFAVRRHVAVLAGSASIYLLLLVVAALLLGFAGGSGVVATTGLVVLLAATAWFGWKVGDWWVERFTVTDRRVLLVSGLLTRRVAIMPLRKVTDLTFERSFVGRLSGYGAFVMESAGQQQALSRVAFLPRPESLYLQMSDLLFGTGDADRDPDEDGVVPARAGRGPRRSRPVGDDRPRPGGDRQPGPRVTSRPPSASEPDPATRRLVPPGRDPGAAPPPTQVRSAGSPPEVSATSPLPSLGRERAPARRPRGRQESDPWARTPPGRPGGVDPGSARDARHPRDPGADGDMA